MLGESGDWYALRNEINQLDKWIIDVVEDVNW